MCATLHTCLQYSPKWGENWRNKTRGITVKSATYKKSFRTRRQQRFQFLHLLHSLAHLALPSCVVQEYYGSPVMHSHRVFPSYCLATVAMRKQLVYGA